LGGVYNNHILENKKNRMSGPPKVVTLIRFGGIRFLAELLQDVQAGAKINVKRLTVHHEGRDGFDASALGFGHPLLGLAEVDDFHLEASGIQCGGKVLFGGHTDGTTGVIELGFGFHVRFVFWFVFLRRHGKHRASHDEVHRSFVGATEGTISWVVTVWFPADSRQ
jgi:hypothetical protein